MIWVFYPLQRYLHFDIYIPCLFASSYVPTLAFFSKPGFVACAASCATSFPEKKRGPLQYLICCDMTVRPCDALEIRALLSCHLHWLSESEWTILLSVLAEKSELQSSYRLDLKILTSMRPISSVKSIYLCFSLFITKKKWMTDAKLVLQRNLVMK